MPAYSDEQLMAYADNELPADERAAMEAAIAAEPALAARVERHRATRRLLQARFAAVAGAPVPQRLLDLLQAAPIERESAIKVVPLRPKPARDFWPLALAASLLLAVGIGGGSWLLRPLPADPLMAVLEYRPSGEPQQKGDEEFLVLSSLQGADGRYCREYERGPRAGDMVRGLACREADGRWQELALRPAPPSTEGRYQLATGEADIAAVLGARRLSHDEERQRIAREWR